jgi:hypothetical protein
MKEGVGGTVGVVGTIGFVTPDEKVVVGINVVEVVDGTGAAGVVCCVHPAVKMTTVRRIIRNFPGLFFMVCYLIPFGANRFFSYFFLLFLPSGLSRSAIPVD